MGYFWFLDQQLTTLGLRVNWELNPTLYAAKTLIVPFDTFHLSDNSFYERKMTGRTCPSFTSPYRIVPFEIYIYPPTKPKFLVSDLVGEEH